MPLAPCIHMTLMIMTAGILLIVLADQLTKLAVIGSMSLGQSIPVIDGFFHITYIKNTGAAFGLFAQHTALLAVVTVILMAGVLFFCVKKKQMLGRFVVFCIMLMIGGGIGNMIDRIFRGYVIDFLDFKVWNPIFNVADVFVCTGCILIIIYVLFVDGRKNGKTD